VHRFSEMIGRKLLYGEYAFAWSIHQMRLRRENGHPKCNCNLDSDWVSHRTEMFLISMVPGFGGPLAIVLLEKYFRSKIANREVFSKKRKIMFRVFKTGCLGGYLSALLRGVIIAFIYTKERLVLAQRLNCLARRTLGLDE